MMPNVPNGPQTEKYVLEGRVVTMDDALDVIADGAIYINHNKIEAVQPAVELAPDGFENAPRVRTGDSIYPGLIELHNHLCYNAMPLWDVPDRYENNGQWRNGKGRDQYRRNISKPSQVLGQTEGVAQALVRFVECRCLLGGVTTSQGITLYNAEEIEEFYRGTIRNVEQPMEELLDPVGTRIGNPEKGKAEKYLETLGRYKCYLQHLSEGVDDIARGWFLNLQLPDDDWAITEAFCGIHCTALQPEDFQVLRDKEASMVWSPLSNYLLYGATANIQAARDAGILIGIGCDWAPSGSKNLLGELKVAWLASEHHHSVFSAKEIVEMATINAAKILEWDVLLGSIKPGKLADLVVINGQQGDDYMRLIEARETSITLVVIDGVPRVGQRRLMGRFGPGTEEIAVGHSTRVLNLAQENSHPLVRDLTLTAATECLRGAMRNLPQLAEDLDNNTAAGLFSGSADFQGTKWQIVLDFDEEDGEQDRLLLGAQRPYADFITQPMELEGITVADDRNYLPKLIAARNLPEFIKKDLPRLYGEKLPLPPSARFLEEKRQELPLEVLATTRDLKTFLRTGGELSMGQRKTIVDQALVLLEQNYVHLPFKRAMHAVDPVQRLRLLQHRMEEIPNDNVPLEIEFHNEIAQIFNSLRDLHTTYRLPYPFRGKVAWLPFMIEAFWEHGRRKYMVSRMVGSPGPDSFKPGVEVLYWNGIPIERAVALNADRQAGSNLEARHARGLNSLTIRPLSHGLPPDEEWVTLTYADDENGETHEFTQEWLVFEPEHSVHSVDLEALLENKEATAAALGVDSHADEIQETKRLLYGGEVVIEERRAVDVDERGEVKNIRRPIKNILNGLETYLPTVFRAKKETTRYGTFGYIRIFTFNVGNAESFVEEFVRLAEQFQENDGLIIDVRGNGGGLIHAAERLLQILTPREITPQKAQFINSAVNLQICRNHDPSTQFKGLDLEPWIESMRQSVETGAAYSLGYPITDKKSCNDRGQAYHGPVLLITDALCYSATDMFAAGFQDHKIGLILSTSKNTGAGGANVWSHALLRELMLTTNDPSLIDSPYEPLPHGAELSVAVRRTLRVGDNAGVVVEDLGIRPDELHKMTRRDLLEHNVDLIEEATKLLAHPIHVTFEPREGALPRVRVETRNVTQLDVLLNDRPMRSFDVSDHVTSFDFQEIVEGAISGKLDLELLAYEGEEFVRRWRERVPRL